MQRIALAKGRVAAGFAILAAVIFASAAHADDAITMKLSTATVNDHQFEWIHAIFSTKVVPPAA